MVQEFEFFGGFGGFFAKDLSGSRTAVQVLHCDCKINTGQPMRLFRLSKGEMTECPNGHGSQKTKQVMSKGI
jgi:hypothetical protein